MVFFVNLVYRLNTFLSFEFRLRIVRITCQSESDSALRMQFIRLLSQSLGRGKAYRPEKCREYTPYISDCMIEPSACGLSQVPYGRVNELVDFVFFLLWFTALRVCSPLGLFFSAAGVPCSAIFLIASSMADPVTFS